MRRLEPLVELEPFVDKISDSGSREYRWSAFPPCPTGKLNYPPLLEDVSESGPLALPRPAPSRLVCGISCFYFRLGFRRLPHSRGESRGSCPSAVLAGRSFRGRKDARTRSASVAWGNVPLPAPLPSLPVHREGRGGCQGFS